jgi:hypothetical protein
MTMTEEVPLEDLSLPKTIDFLFEHKLFSIDCAVFRKTSDGDEIALFVPIGDAVAGIPVHQIADGFEIKDNSIDSKLLHYVTMGLKYVREIRPGDSLPREVLLGTAPWMIDKKYKTIARSRIKLQLALQSTGEDIGEFTTEQLIAKANETEMGVLAEKEYVAMSEKLTLGENVEDKLEGTKELAERVAMEMCYIDALREQMQKIRLVQKKMKTFASSYSNEKSVHESVIRCNTLVDTPIRKTFDCFNELDAYTCEVLNTLRQFDTQVAHIREVRDQLRDTYMLWEELLNKWADKNPNDKADADFLIRETYQFAARHFVQTSEW